MDRTESQLAVERPEPDPDVPCYWIKIHGGLGDAIWLMKKAVNFPLPLHISISSENRSRPRRSADLVRHLPNVISWNYDTTSFCPDTGQDWPPQNDPCCAMKKKFSQLDIRPNVKTRLECNRWLEGGRRIEDWLPDIKTEHHFEFKPCGPPTLDIKTPNVILHLAGWPDVADDVWTAAADLFRAKCHVYIVGGSYDFRPRRIHAAVNRCLPGVSLIEDTSWENLVGLLKSTTFCFGHASGFTALADVLKVPGATFNPRAVPGLIGSWNSKQYDGMLHVDRNSDFQNAIGSAMKFWESSGTATWPLTAKIGPKISLDNRTSGSEAARAVRAACSMGARNSLVWSVDKEAPDDIPAAVLDGAYSCGKIVRRLDIVGFNELALARAYKETSRSTAKPLIDVHFTWPISNSDDSYDLAVVYCSERAVESSDACRQAWARLSSNGTILIGGASSKTASETLAATLRTKAAQVADSDEWYYLHRRLGA